MDIQRYSEDYAQQYQERTFETVLVEIRRAHVLDRLRQYPHRHVLEVGCGLRPLFPDASDYESFTIVEPSSVFTAEAQRLADGRSDIHVITGFLESSREQFAGREFDFVIVSSLLHEVADPGALLDAVRSVCTPETVVHLNVPNVRSFHRLLAVEMGLIPDVDTPSELERRFQRHGHYDRERLRSILLGHGFRPIHEDGYFVKLFTHAQMQAILDAGILPASAIAGLERMAKYMPDLVSEISVEARRV